jgi:hypothetical protein
MILWVSATITETTPPKVPTSGGPYFVPVAGGSKASVQSGITHAPSAVYIDDHNIVPV